MTAERPLPALRARVAAIIQAQYEDDLTADGRVAHPDQLGQRITQALTVELAELNAWRLSWYASGVYVEQLRAVTLPRGMADFGVSVLTNCRQVTRQVFTESGLTPPADTEQGINRERPQR